MGVIIDAYFQTDSRDDSNLSKGKRPNSCEGNGQKVVLALAGIRPEKHRLEPVFHAIDRKVP